VKVRGRLASSIVVMRSYMPASGFMPYKALTAEASASVRGSFNVDC
jgi:hypothetical protein